MQKSKRTRIGTPYSVLWLNHIARYAQSLTAPNLTHCCDPDVNKFCATGSETPDGRQHQMPLGYGEDSKSKCKTLS